MLAYCDFIAHTIKQAFTNDKPENLIKEVGNINWDLHPEEGYMLSTTKTLNVSDVNGKQYRITVEEV